MPYAFGGVSTIAFDGTIQWTSATDPNNGAVESETAVGRKLWEWSNDAKPIRNALASALFDGKPETYIAGWMPHGGSPVLRTKATVFPLPRGRMHDAVLLWAEAHTGRVLTKGEARTLRTIAEGFTQQEAARHLGLSQATIKATLSRVRLKMGAKTVAHAIYLATKRGML